MPVDDRTTKARIRDAAICEIAARPVGTTTIRDIAAAAGVSPGSVIHHFESMDGLHRACNEYVAAVIRDYKSRAVASPHGFNVLASLSGIRDLPVTAYLAKTALGDSPIVADLIDELVDDAVAYMDEGIEAGTILPTDDPRGRAAVLVMWSLGGLVLHRHLERQLGVDLTDPEAVTSPQAARYAQAALGLMAHGTLTDSYAEQMQRLFDDLYGPALDDHTSMQAKG